MPASETDRPFANSIAEVLHRHRAVTAISGDVPIGASLIAEADANLTRAQALVFICGAVDSALTLPAWEVVQFRYALALGANAVLVVIPRAPFLLPVPNGHRTLLAPYGLTADQAARHCLAAVKFQNGDVPLGSALDALPPDRRFAGALSDGAWSTAVKLGERYEKQATVIFELLDLNYRDEASKLYWDIFHYSGYREAKGQLELLLV